MKDKTTKQTDTASEAATPATEPQTVQVHTRFDRAELDAMKDETGATADGTAVACFVRKNLRKRG